MEVLVAKITEQLFATGNLALVILFGGNIFLARAWAKEREAREAADKADREYAERHTEVLRAMSVVLGEIKGVLTNWNRKP